MNIYVVCTGNTCRSPMAEAILNHKQLPNTTVKSAGIYAVNGAQMSEQAQVVLNEHGIAHSHRSKQLSEDDLKWATLVLTMTNAHKELILRSYPRFADKVFTLKEYVSSSSDLDVSDPFGGSVDVYRQTFNELSQLIDKLEKLNREGHS